MDTNEITQRLGPVSSLVLAVLLVILGFLVISVPQIIPWLLGIGLILAGTALIVGILVPGRRVA